MIRLQLNQTIRPYYVEYAREEGWSRGGWRSFTNEGDARDFLRVCRERGFEARLHSKLGR